MQITQKHALQIELQQEYQLAQWLNDVFN